MKPVNAGVGLISMATDDLVQVYALLPHVKPSDPGVQVSVPQTLVTPVAEHPESVAKNVGAQDTIRYTTGRNRCCLVKQPAVCPHPSPDCDQTRRIHGRNGRI